MVICLPFTAFLFLYLQGVCGLLFLLLLWPLLDSIDFENSLTATLYSPLVANENICYHCADRIMEISGGVAV